MDKKTWVHVAAEAAIFGGISVYLLNEVSSLKKEVKQLKLDLQVVAKQQVKVQNSHTKAVTKALSNPSNSHHHRPTQLNPSQQSPHRAVHTPHRQPPTSSAKIKRTRFQDEEEESFDDDEFEDEMASSSEEFDEPEPSPPQRRKMKKPEHGRRKLNRVIQKTPVSFSNEPAKPVKGARPATMDDTKALAERLKREAMSDL